MRLIVNKHKIEIKRDLVNEKEINVTKCYFEFDEEITNDFTKEAYFTLNGKTYKQLITNDECDIPSEVLDKKGQVEIGVVAYKIANEEYEIRYNPSPAYFSTLIGSLKQNYENSSNPTPSEIEQIESAVANKQDTLISGTNIKTINNESILGSGNIEIQGGGSSDYSSLENKPKINNVELNGNKSLSDLGIDQNFVKDSNYVHTDNNYTTNEKTKLASLENYDDTEIKQDIADLENSIPTKTSDLTNDSGFITNETDPVFSNSAASGITSNDITNWNNKSTFSGDYNDLTNKPTIPTVPTNVSAFTNDAGYLTSHQDISGKENISNKVTSITSSSTNTEYPSAKAVYDLFTSITDADEVSY